jgi:hypothetical protein
MDTAYLGEEFFAAVRASAQRCRERGLLVWLYDEDRWPSGFAGGLVTREARYRSKHLLFTPTPYSGVKTSARNISHSVGSRNEQGVLLGAYDVELGADGRLASYRRLKQGESAAGARGRVWYAYLETAEPNQWFNNQGYVDTLSREAIERFVEVTHEAYRRELGSEFGKSVPAMFTDEPQFAHKQYFQHPFEVKDIFLPWTTDLAETFLAAYGFDLLEHVPELFWERSGGEASLARYRYHDHVAERFAGAFADTCGRWCEGAGIMLTGHMMEEPTLFSQTHALGEAMRSYRSFHLPGIDMLCDWREYTTAKQAQSACHQYGRPGVLSELYGVTGWDFTFTGHKGQGDWQAALGVTVRVHHLNWVSMKGEAKRDYPAAIGYQSPWYREYPLVEDHFARVNVAMTRGEPLVRVGVIHPIESYWLCFGPRDQTQAEREEREGTFRALTEWLLFGLTDFDFLCESLLPTQCPGVTGNKFPVGKMRYDVVVVPPMRTIRATTLERLEAFVSAGGKLVFAGEVPTLVDAARSDRAEKLAARAVRAGFSRSRLLEALEDVRVVGARLGWGGAADTLLHQVRRDGDSLQLFICNTDRVNARPGTKITVAGRWSVTLLDTLTGEVRALPAAHQGEQTHLTFDFPAAGHLLATLSPASSPTVKGEPQTNGNWEEVARPDGRVRITLAEPNVLLLDRAVWRFAGEETWQASEEILRLDNLVRRRVGLPDRTGDIPQPWTDREPAPALAEVELRFVIRSEVAVSGAKLALEDAGETSVWLNGARVTSKPEGYYVDESIATVALPSMAAGEHELVLRRPFTRRSELEACYLLGDFGVRLEGTTATLTTPVREAGFGDLARHGLPFYGGNVVYHVPVRGDGREVMLEATRFGSPLLAVSLKGKRAGTIAFPPYRLELGKLGVGESVLEITAFGNRFNTFGPLHCYDRSRAWWGPDSYRTEGENWGYEYNLRPTGLLTAPRVMVRG